MLYRQTALIGGSIESGAAVVDFLAGFGVVVLLTAFAVWVSLQQLRH